MKSNASAGFKSKPLPEGIAATHGSQPNIEEKKEKSEEEHFKELEDEGYLTRPDQLKAAATNPAFKPGGKAEKIGGKTVYPCF